MMQIQIKNFGPISEANIRVGGLTIFAGPNNTGKSFASRLIYSIVNSLQSDLYIEHADRLLNSLHRPIILLELEEHIRRNHKRASKRSEIFGSILEIISGISSKVLTLDPREINSQDSMALLENSKLNLDKHLGELRSQKTKRNSSTIMRMLDSYFERLTLVYESIAKNNIRDNFVRTQLRTNIEKELIGNFQLASIEALFRSTRSVPTINFAGNGNELSINLDRSGGDSRVKLTNVDTGKYYPSNLFLESPIYWKLGASFFDRRFSLAFSDIDKSGLRRPIPGVPDFVSSLRSKLLREYSGKVAFPEILDWINGDNVLRGKLVVSTGGQLRYQDDNRQYPLQTTATGITSIGIIGLLIERKLINEKTILFFDEPESNLHPAWQVAMAQLLLKLAQAGVSVVIATHSIDIIKFIEMSAQSDPTIVELVNLNRFPDPDGTSGDFFDQIKVIQDELSDPYYHLYTGGASDFF